MKPRVGSWKDQQTWQIDTGKGEDSNYQKKEGKRGHFY